MEELAKITVYKKIILVYIDHFTTKYKRVLFSYNSKVYPRTFWPTNLTYCILLVYVLMPPRPALTEAPLLECVLCVDRVQEDCTVLWRKQGPSHSSASVQCFRFRRRLLTGFFFFSAPCCSTAVFVSTGRAESLLTYNRCYTCRSRIISYLPPVRLWVFVQKPLLSLSSIEFLRSRTRQFRKIHLLPN